MLRRTRRNLARRLGTAPENRREALYTENIQRILTTLPDTPIGARDRALLGLPGLPTRAGARARAGSSSI